MSAATRTTADLDRVYLALYSAFEDEGCPQSAAEMAERIGRPLGWTSLALRALVRDGRASVAPADKDEGRPNVYTPAMDREDRELNLRCMGRA